MTTRLPDIRMRRHWFASILVKLYRVLPLKPRIVEIITRIEGGHMLSLSLRDILREHHGVTVGDYSYGSLLVPGMADPHTAIGRYVSVGPNVRRFGAAHPMQDASMHPFWYNPRLGLVGNERDVPRSAIEIGSDSWIGANVTILPGCTRIGVGAVIGAGAIVTKDVGDFEVVLGTPARQVATRLSAEQRNLMLHLRPWDHDPRSAREILDAIDEQARGTYA